MGRLPKLPPEQMTDAQRALYDAIVGGPRAHRVSPFPLTDETGALGGPFNAMLLQPELGGALQALGGAVRYRTALSGRAREIAILSVARGWDSAYERYAHEAVGRANGLSEADLEALRDGRTEVFADPAERLVAETTAALVARGDLSDEEFAEARAGLGLPMLFELTTLVGYYATLAMQLRVFRVEPPEPLDTANTGRQDSD
jgi:4-carboxymuconolactone decarboxylase